MEISSFILQRFYYSLASGCIINFFVLLNYIVLVKTNLLPEDFFSGVMGSGIFPVLVFTVTAVITGIFIEGVEEAGFQHYTELHEARKLYVKTTQGKEKWKLKNRIRKLVFRKATVVEACIYYWKKENRDGKIPENSIYAFMCSPGSSGPVPALWTCALQVLRKEKKYNNVDRFKDLSFMVQMMRLSFLCISMLSFPAGIAVLARWAVRRENAWLTLGVFYLLGFIVPALLFFMATPIAMYLGRRYVREIGLSYNALKLQKKL